MLPKAAVWLLAAVTILAGGATPAHSQTATANYRISVRVAPESQELNAEAWIQNPSSTRFWIFRGFQINHVDIDGKVASYHVDPLTPPFPYAPATVAMIVDAPPGKLLHLTYHGKMPDLIFGVNLISPELVELAIYSGWYPLFENGGTFSYDLRTDLPASFTPHVNGRRVSRKSVHGRDVSTWTSFRPTTDIVVVASPKLHSSRAKTQTDKLVVTAANLPRRVVEQETELLANAMRRLTALYGPAHSPANLELVYSPRPGWGYSRLPMIIVSEERAMQTLNSNLGEANEFRSNAHELAHFWWMIADAASPDDWINEGLAEYTAFRLTSDRFGEAFASARIDEYRHNVTSRRAHESIAETPGDSPDREANRYDRATLMMLEAERRFGREAVDRFLRHLYSEHAQTRQATTEEFLREVRQELGRPGEDYFREALYAHD